MLVMDVSGLSSNNQTFILQEMISLNMEHVIRFQKSSGAPMSMGSTSFTLWRNSSREVKCRNENTAKSKGLQKLYIVKKQNQKQ